MKSYYQRKQEFLELQNQYLNKRLSFGWYKQYNNLKIGRVSKFDLLFPGPILLLLSFLYIVYIDYKISDILIIYTDFNFIKLINLGIFLSFLEFGLFLSSDYLPPLLLTIIRYKPTTIMYDNKIASNQFKYTSISFIILLSLSIIVLSTSYDILNFSGLSVAVLGFIILIVIDLFVPGYLWNNILSNSMNFYKDEWILTRDKAKVFPDKDEVMSLENNQKSILSSKKSIIFFTDTCGCFLEGTNLNDQKSLIKLYIILTFVSLLAYIFLDNNWKLIYFVTGIVSTIYLIYKILTITIFRKLTFKRKKFGLKIFVYSQKMVDMSFSIEELDYYNFKEHNEYTFSELNGFLYFDENIKVDLGRDYNIKVNEIPIKFSINLDFLENELGGFFPDEIKVVLFN